MDKTMELPDYVSTLRYFIALSRDETLSDNARSVLAQYAQAMIMSYRVDDFEARLIK